jgi:regulator of cell morphogenesis and NO signaling
MDLKIHNSTVWRSFMNVAPETPVGAVVAERLGRARVFERLGIDYCCHGATPLAEACSQRSLDLAEVISEIAECDLRDANEDVDRVNYGKMRASELADHILETHHTYLRRELPRLFHLMDKVVAAHGAAHPELADLRNTLTELRRELEMHMIKEERALFPLIKQLETARAPFPIHCGSVENPIRVMEHEHETVGSGLERMRALTRDYRPPADGCASLAALYDGLASLEADLHRHIHKENNILFPKAAKLESALDQNRG